MSLPLRVFAIALILLCTVLAAGCSSPAPAPKTGSVHVASGPAGAGVYLDSGYRGTTPASISAVPAGSHTLEVRMSGFEPWTSTITVAAGEETAVTAGLTPLPVTLPVTFATPAPAAVPTGIPQIHVDGYWTYPQGRTAKENPVPLLVHTEAFNVGTADAREVTVSANFRYEGHEVCWSTIYLGTLAAGGHVSRDSLVSCTLPWPYTDAGLDVRFEDLVVRPSW